MLDLDKIEKDHEIATTRWSQIERRVATTRLLEQIPVLVAELTQAREELREARAEIERLRALVPPADLLYRLADYADNKEGDAALALARRIEEASDGCHPIIVRYNFSADAWIVDEDSCHALEDGNGATIKELRVRAIRDLFLEDTNDRT